MRQVLLASAGEVRLEDAPLREPGRGQLRVRAEAVGIGGSDLHAFAGKHPFIELPVRYNPCEHLVVVGCQTAGALAEAFVAPAARFHAGWSSWGPDRLAS